MKCCRERTEEGRKKILFVVSEGSIFCAVVISSTYFIRLPGLQVNETFQFPIATRSMFFKTSFFGIKTFLFSPKKNLKSAKIRWYFLEKKLEIPGKNLLMKTILYFIIKSHRILNLDFSPIFNSDLEYLGSI